eukprot:snap_masked-scaffold427_size174323-processed-gene-0.1 protein:Tk04500 transcript:snap_masked-scaffold427_size174323-processed-gene-0.1-mRNA-1 annotation:"hypothetical protein DAPPUDRAFT_306325"
MSLAEYGEFIREHDRVILYISFKQMYPLLVTRDKVSKAGDTSEHVFQTTFGALRVADLIGRRFGTRVQLSRGYAYALHPTPELWTRALPHRTQILYTTDIAMIMLQLEIKPGSVVVESGTGSGSLSHSFIRTIAPHGHLHTYDYHAARVETARAEFDTHHVGPLVTATHRDVCAEGFGLEGVADAVFLDLPHPWTAVPHASRALKASGGRICSFSPCIEQVQKTAQALRSAGFTELTTLECLLREFQVRKISMPEFDPDKPPRSEGQRPETDQNGSTTTPAAPSYQCPEKSFVTGVPLLKMPGHTGYLTFATWPVQLTVPTPE